MTAVRELLVLYLAMAIAPLGPALALTYAEAPWQTVALAVAWAVCWYTWLSSRLRRQS